MSEGSLSYLCDDLSVVYDRSSDELREEDHKKEILSEASSLYLLTIEIDQKGNLLKGIK